MAIQGVEGLTYAEVNAELDRGARFVVFEYCISVIILSFKRGSDIYFIRSGEGTFGKSIGYTMISLAFGWWGIPWGPIFTIWSVFTNLSGGKNVTAEVLAAFAQTPDSPQPPPMPT